ncbi:hypothetical protein ACWD3J_38780 [Streptomyces sp. NPDC002755]|uniref:hypothetical protein n=1 Tax=Streptomyces sp. NPDC002884 TaxID=3154544 RepID=UPI003318E67C
MSIKRSSLGLSSALLAAALAVPGTALAAAGPERPSSGTWPAVTTQVDAPKVIGWSKYQRGQLEYLSVSWTGRATGFGFKGVNGSGWAEEHHRFTSPSYGKVGSHTVDYPFNLGCGTHHQVKSSDVMFWIETKSGARSNSIVARLSCG